MLTYQSFKEYFRKQGIDYREIYPDSADLKNYETRAIENTVHDGQTLFYRLFVVLFFNRAGFIVFQIDVYKRQA